MTGSYKHFMLITTFICLLFFLLSMATPYSNRVRLGLTNSYSLWFLQKHQSDSSKFEFKQTLAAAVLQLFPSVKYVQEKLGKQPENPCLHCKNL